MFSGVTFSTTTTPQTTLSSFNPKHNPILYSRKPTSYSLFPPPQRRRVASSASILHLPLLPFPLDQVLVPCEVKTLHLYEARYLALLDESLFKKRKQFVHFVLDPIAMSQTSAEVSFAARYGCLVMIEKVFKWKTIQLQFMQVERLDVGAMVSVRGVGRVKIAQFEQAEPYLKGAVVPLLDSDLDSTTDISSKVCELRESIQSLNNLEVKLKAPREALLQTQVANCLTWAESVPNWDLDESFIPALPERVSFAAFQPITGSSEMELITLQKEKLKAMDIKYTKERLESSLEFTANNISRVAAKLAIQSLDFQ
ncbi:protease [Lithospermum erythrorhizon]|uniref:Protease n=1 Tax=Lithospermum erythrorhizon TaxID=34254 RepID=A0AAV3PU99_LITER